MCELLKPAWGAYDYSLGKAQLSVVNADSQPFQVLDLLFLFLSAVIRKKEHTMF